VGTTAVNENCIHEEIMRRLISGNSCCRSVQNILSFSSYLKPKRHNLKEGLLEKTKLAQHAYEEGWDAARILEIESNSRCRKYKESPHVACLSNPISQLIVSSDSSPIWIPLISNEVSNSQGRSG
jgi:hypothetical protein